MLQSLLQLKENSMDWIWRLPGLLALIDFMFG
jgi:hypothetical protein